MSVDEELVEVVLGGGLVVVPPAHTQNICRLTSGSINGKLATKRAKRSGRGGLGMRWHLGLHPIGLRPNIFLMPSLLHLTLENDIL